MREKGKGHDEILLEDPRLSVSAAPKPRVASKGGITNLTICPIVQAKGRSNSILVGSGGQEEESQAEPTPRSSVFDRLTSPTPRESIFNRLSVSIPTKEGTSHVRRSTFDKLESLSTSKVASQSKVEKGDTRKKGESEICSLVPSRTTDEPCPIFVSALLTPAEEKEYLELLTKYKDVFAWTYKEMSRLDLRVTVHQLAIKQEAHPVKQAQRRFRPELIFQIEAEVNKLEQAGFIREVQFPKWIANIVPVKKKNGQIRVYVNFRDLNRACPKDDFPLPNTELMVDSTIGHEALSFMDGSSGYNQIRMVPEDEELTAFRTPKGIYCYKVMPFGLKNAGAIYQQAMQKIFDDILHKIVQCYVNDLVVKTRKREEHIRDLRIIFNRLKKYQLKMNPLKCAFGVTSGKFLGFIIQHRGIEVDQSKIDAIQRMPEPKNLRELRSLQGFPIPGKPLILYIATQEQSLGALLAQKNEAGKEKALYYLSRKLTGAELKYSPIEKMCLALFFSIHKLRHYMQAHTMHLVAKVDPVNILSRSIISGRLAKWSVAFQEFEILYVPQKAIKGQALANFLADHPIPADWELSDDFPDEDVLYTEILPPWMMFFDGAACHEESGAGVVFVSPQKHMLPSAFRLNEPCSNNVAEYQALIAGLQMALDMKISYLEVYGDSKLVINQLLTHYEVKNEEEYTSETNAISVSVVEDEDWRQPLIDYLEHGKLPNDSRHKTEGETDQAMEETHSGDCMDYAKRCEARQLHANYIHQPPEPLHPTIASWPFDAWGLDVVGPLPKSSAGHLYILAATDYFSKWAEVISLKEVKKENVMNFIQTHLIYRYGIPRYIMTDNGKPFYNSLVDQLCEKFGFKQYKSSMYNAPANGLAEAFNKTLFLPLERQIPSLRIAIQEGLTNEENARLRLEELEALDEKRLEAQQHLECYQVQLSRAFNKKVKPRSFQQGDLVLAVRRPINTLHKIGNKFTSKWDGPYVV
uniref:Uncharacterized protein n=1 Tax=Fagus sylvatica TaxID=28930 RepID=A0A2N9F6K1_FAGSY